MTVACEEAIYIYDQVNNASFNQTGASNKMKLDETVKMLERE